MEESDKLNVVADIETIQSQLAKPSPSKHILSAAWAAAKGTAVASECVALVDRVADLIAPLITS